MGQHIRCVGSDECGAGQHGRHGVGERDQVVAVGAVADHFRVYLRAPFDGALAFFEN